MGARRAGASSKLPGKVPRKFLASIYRIWMMRYVDVPDEVARALKKEAGKESAKYIAVVATVNGQSVRTTLLPAGGGKYRMQFNTVLRKAASADTGDVVGVTIALDRGSREIPVPADLRVALRKHAKAKKAFEKCPPGHRRQILKWMAEAKSEATRAKRIDLVIDRMLERAILGPEKPGAKAKS
jgi:hypothetical protein